MQATFDGGRPAFALIGLPETSTKECRDRVRAALTNSGHPLPQQQIAVTLSSDGRPVYGTGCDLAIAVALLCAKRVLPTDSARCVHLGELGLNGSVRPVRGVVAAALAAVRAGLPHLVVADENVREAELVPGTIVHGVRSLDEVVRLHREVPFTRPTADNRSRADQARGAHPGFSTGDPGDADDPATEIAEVTGPPAGRHAIEVAAAGGHHLLLIGASDAGTERLASTLVVLLPRLTDQQALQVVAIRSVAGTLDPDAGVIRRPPFEHPHPTATTASLVGRSSGIPTPGVFSRSHQGVLLLTNVGDFDIQALEALRRPLDLGELLLGRGQDIIRFPARVQLALTTHSCPCGLPSPEGQEGSCSCSASARRRYLSRVPGWLRDRIDLQIDVTASAKASFSSTVPPETTGAMAERVAAARAVQYERLGHAGWACNAQVPGSWLCGALRLPQKVTQDLDQQRERSQLSVRGYYQVLRVAWTLADLAGCSTPDKDILAEALRLRQNGDVR